LGRRARRCLHVNRALSMAFWATDSAWPNGPSPGTFIWRDNSAVFFAEQIRCRGCPARPDLSTYL